MPAGRRSFTGSRQCEDLADPADMARAWSRLAKASARPPAGGGREPHSEPETFRRDRRRQNALLGSGRHVLRYAAFDALVDPEEVADDIIAVLRRRRAARR
jgi:hypothetical protein